MKVLKFGGSSVSDATNISRVLDIVAQAAKDDRVVLVSSAMSGITDSLELLAGRCESHDVEAYREIIGQLRERHSKAARRLFSSESLSRVCAAIDGHIEGLSKLCSSVLNGAPLDTHLRDEICGTGELLSTLLLESKLADEGWNTLWQDSRQLIVRDDMPLTYSNIQAMVEAYPKTEIFVVPGFVARDSQGNICTLGRGGSDHSASIFAAALNASDLQIWTDVSGILTTNPKCVPNAKTIGQISYDAAFAMASNGAKVLYAPAVAPAREAGIAICIRNTFRPQDRGTVICAQAEPQQCRWMGLAAMNEGEYARLTLVAEGPVEAQDALRRASAALREAGIAPLSCDVRTNTIALFVKPCLSVASQMALHKEFFEREEIRRIDLYIAGCGKVGGALRQLVEGNMAKLSGKSLEIKAISSDHGFVDRLLERPDRGAVFVDCTDSEDIWKYYTALLDAGFNIVTSNRRAMAVPYVEYRAMKEAALRNGLFLRYETTVGASLPMLETIARSSSCGDRVSSIEAVVSCTLNYILSSDLPFSEALEQARKSGLTEKDPQDDLGGRDALRKLLILAREAGVPLDAEDVEVEPLSEDSNPDKDMRFVASISEDRSSNLGYKARIALRKVGPEHPAHWLRGTDNAIIIKSLYHPTPLVILGPGEGAELAASSILNDILL